jgi:glycosyltransferase involved in cell wall biosynthesis
MNKKFQNLSQITPGTPGVIFCILLRVSVACQLSFFSLKAKQMRIAQVAPLSEAVPPKLYGGTERVIHYLTEELVKMGHDVTLFASGDSVTTAELIPIVKEALRLDPDCVDPLPHHIVQLEEVLNLHKSFDIIHFHTDYFHFPLSSRISTAVVTTLHGRLDIPDLQPLFNHFRDQPVISISNDQRTPLPQANWVGTVYHGLSSSLHKLGAGQGNYLAFMGRISPEKGVDKAIEIAIKSGIPLKIAAKVDKADQEYFETEIEHLMNNPLIEFIGEINEREKTAFLGRAKALLFPINWSEPFGMVMIEAMSCGTPVIAFNRGSVPEVLDEGVTGFIVNNVEEAVSAVEKINNISRSDIRKVFEEKFSARRMAKDYLKIYENLEHRLQGNPQNLNNKAWKHHVINQ